MNVDKEERVQSSMPDSFSEVKTLQAVQGNQISQHEKHLDRLDASMEKLTEVSISLKEIVKNHDSQLIADSHERKNLRMSIEATKRESDMTVSKVRQELIELRDELKEDLNGIGNTLRDSLTEISEDFNKTTNELSTKITESKSVFDKYKWIIMGAGIVLIFLIDRGPTILAIIQGSSGS